jgi:hypothetical protein
MPLLTNPQIDELANLALISDREIRSDLSREYISSENDYTSNFTGAFRRNVNTYSDTGLSATSFLVPPDVERAGGIDATIIISNTTASKVIFFEAKWPRFAIPNFAWDYAQTATGLSHFSDQLDRQSQMPSKYPVFEMFYVEFPFTEQPNFLFDYNSSCLWHDDAVAFRNQRATPDAIWTQNDCEDLLKKSSHNIGFILGTVAACSKGQSIAMIEPGAIIRELHLEGNILAIRADRAPD